MTWIKICGITNLLDAQEAVLLGADALGFIFADSKRKVKPQAAKEIIDLLPGHVEKIGVFLDEKAQEVEAAARFCGLTGLQLHGSESPKYCKGFAQYKVIKAFRVNERMGWEEIGPYAASGVVDRILLDTYVEGIPGGTGKTFPWRLVPQLRKSLTRDMPVIAAGGINPLNVLQAIKEANPFGIDVGSGVERQAGVKDHEKLKQLIYQVKKSGA
ncbi:phosphoribosylanthranilate isomerase [Desulfitibacter alkalitolerans]|uniref:phosphoribosylanthranilate isomerase n=1 Tax=Desulfitibacter alkalitolerans TaxID=264641 RepID=UPI000488F701|nr:phosphoribosylanthranilate isomerase [Desulfitibacter alkalitolerans]